MTHPVLHFERIDSTNLEARRLAEKGERGPLWIVADEQTGGRGRLGRSWVSEPGNLYATFLFSISAGAEVAAQVSFVAALAVHDMAVALAPLLRPRIKWPNDVLIGGAKFCGVLAEVVGQLPTRIAIGCGVNVTHAPEGTPYPVTCLAAQLFPLRGAGRVPVAQQPAGGASAAAGEGPHPSRAGGPARATFPRFADAKPEKDVSVELVFQHLNPCLSNRLNMWDEGRGFAAIRSDWEERALGSGGEVTANGVSGIFKGLAADGALIMELPDGGRKLIHSGEVTFAELETLRRA